MKLWVVETGTQEVNLVCRIFRTEEAAQAYAATAREWYARNHSPDYRQYFTAENHRADLVDEAKASAKEFPFGSDHQSEFWTVTAYEFEDR